MKILCLNCQAIAFWISNTANTNKHHYEKVARKLHQWKFNCLVLAKQQAI
jgi:hypothetical protein